jgi:hypothetical protein
MSDDNIFDENENPATKQVLKHLPEFLWSKNWYSWVLTDL